MRRALGLFLGAVLISVGILGSLVLANWQPAALGVVEPRNTAVATFTPTAEPTARPDTAQALESIVVPSRDMRVLAERLRPVRAPIPLVVNQKPPVHWLGEKAQFRVSNSDTRGVFTVTATLRVLSEHTAVWVQDGLLVDQKALDRAARTFDEQIYPTVHRFFGSEWMPGIDHDPRIAVLNARFSGAAGYYTSSDEFSRLAAPYSNEREMFYLNYDSITPGSDRYEAILAHEFQHMVHWHLDSNEDTWVNEGASELAARLCGYGVSDAVPSFARQPDTQLNAWMLDPDEDPLPHYGASYLWMDYFLQRLGPDALKAVEAEPRNGIEGFEAVLRKIPNAPTFDELFADWVVANLLDNTSIEDGRYGHQWADPHVTMQAVHREFPVRGAGMVCQYGTDYISLLPEGKPIKIEFSGNRRTLVVPNEPYQGCYEWWANRGDMSDTTLTRALDLRGVKRATLEYALWYQLEDGWDYGYVEVSTDGGVTWMPLSTDHTTTYNPNGNAFGPGYTGFSGHPAGSTKSLTSEWVREKVDLTPYVGERILVRFEQVTDDAVNLAGMCIDDISVSEVGFRDDAEHDVPGWDVQGFVRSDNELPQKFLVQAILLNGQEPRVHRLQLDGQQHGTLIVEGYDRVTLAISGLTRHTTEKAFYTYAITPYEEQPPQGAPAPTVTAHPGY